MTQQQKIDFKNKLKRFCEETISHRIDASKAAIANAQAASNNEEKSSAGDKYETARAMGHLEKDMHARQLSAHLKELGALHDVQTQAIFEIACPGALIQLSESSIFIAAGLGPQTIDGKTIIFISQHAPLAMAVYHKKKKEMIRFNGMDQEIIDLY